MGLLIDGDWIADAELTDAQRAQARSAPRFRRWIEADSAAGLTPDPGRYTLIVSLACPWAHRTLLMRRLLGLADAVDMVVVHPVLDDDGWRFGRYDGADAIGPRGEARLRELYLRSDPAYTGFVTVPVLWDRWNDRIVSNESAEIMRMLAHAFDTGHRTIPHPVPGELQVPIDALNQELLEAVNRGVYYAGFATSQAAYERAAERLFETLNRLDARLGTWRYLLGAQPTEPDWRLLPTLLRFDAVYHTHFKCNLRRIEDYPNLAGYLRDLYQIPGVAETVRLDHIKRHYYDSHRHLNPRGHVPIGPELQLSRPHDREALGGWSGAAGLRPRGRVA